MSRQLKFVLSALGAAWAVDLLFWQAGWGINFTVWVALTLAIGFILARSEQVKPARLTWLLAVITLGLAAITFLRSQPFTLFISLLLSMLCLMLTAATFRHANWPHYRLVDYITTALKFLLALLIRPWEVLTKPHPPAPAADPGAPTAQHTHATWKRALPVLRGLLLALPVLLIFATLLASADPIFGDQLRSWLSWFRVENLGEIIFRLVYILILAFVFIGALLHAIHPAKEEPRPDTHKDWVTRLLGWTETFIVLLAVNLLFIFFLVIQFWYLFGGQANISTTAYTYSEYARRGFNELVAVAVLSLGLYLGLATITRLESPAHRRWFTALSTLLILQVLVILASAFQRLLLYENAYGWTELRTITHFFIIWLALLLLATIVLELLRRRHRFGLAALVFALGFGITLGLLNVDGFIAQRNIARAAAGAELDAKYLGSLSSDAVPVFFQEYQRPDLPKTVKDALGAELACRADALSSQSKSDWRSFNASGATANAVLTANQASWSQYPVTRGKRGTTVRIDGVERQCQLNVFFKD